MMTSEEIMGRAYTTEYTENTEMISGGAGAPRTLSKRWNLTSGQGS
jgi:hypothetical protein